MSPKSTLVSQLKIMGYSNTHVRQNVFNALFGREPTTMAELITRLPSVDRASIYRTVAVFENAGILQRLNTGWKYKLELSDLFSDHHHHATCSSCQTVVSFQESQYLEDGITGISESIGFIINSHSLEIRGLCSDCQKRPTGLLINT